MSGVTPGAPPTLVLFVFGHVATATLPGNASVAPNDTVTIHTASGTSAGKDIYLGQEASALLSGLQPGATVALVDAQGATVNEFVLPR